MDATSSAPQMYARVTVKYVHVTFSVASDMPHVCMHRNATRWYVGDSMPMTSGREASVTAGESNDRCFV